MKIKTFGWRRQYLDQISRIEEGFLALGHELVEENPDLIYCNNDFYDDALDYAKKYPNALRIFNILDLQLHNPSFDFKKLQYQLEFGITTCISETVKREIKEYLNIDAINIGNPIKDIECRPEIKKEIDYLIVGRLRDKNKRANLFEQLLMLPENTGKTYAAVGSEPLPMISSGYLGILSDKDLEEVYNMTKFVICCSKREGLNLPMLEAFITSVPIVCYDMSTCWEFVPMCFRCDSTAQSINEKIKEINKKYEYYRSIALEYGKMYKKQFNKVKIARNILDVYEKFKK